MNCNAKRTDNGDVTEPYRRVKMVFGCKDIPEACPCAKPCFCQRTAIASISTKTPLGSSRTATALRAGNGSAKALAYSAFMAAKSPMSARNTVVFTTLAVLRPAASRMAARFLSDWAACAEIPSGTLPVAGSTGIWPDTKTNEPASMAWL